MIFVFVEIIAKIIIENTLGKKHARSNTYLNTSSNIFIDKAYSKDPNKREHYWRDTLKSMEPQGLNVEFCFFNISHTLYSHDCLY